MDYATLRFSVFFIGCSVRFLIEYVIAVQVKLELKVGRNNSKEKGIIEETKKLKATALVIGSNSRTMFGM